MITQGVKYNNYYFSDKHHTVLHSRQDKYKCKVSYIGIHFYQTLTDLHPLFVWTASVSYLLEEELQIMKYGQYCNSLGLFPLYFHKHNDTRSITRRGISYLECK